MLDPTDRCYIRDQVVSLTVAVLFFGVLSAYLLISQGLYALDIGATLLGVLLSGWLQLKAPHPPQWGAGRDHDLSAASLRLRAYVASFGRSGFAAIIGSELALGGLLLLISILQRQWWGPDDPAFAFAPFMLASIITMCACWLSVYMRIMHSWANPSERNKYG